MNEQLETVPIERIEKAIFLIRGEKVMLDRDLAELYGVETRVLNQAVRRNLERLPPDFMFELTREEIMEISQIVTSSSVKFSKRVTAFTEPGVAMLSSGLRSKRAISVNVEIMRTFVRLRQMLSSNAELAKQLKELERKYDRQFKVVFDAIRQLMMPTKPKRKQIGFQGLEAAAQLVGAHRLANSGVLRFFLSGSWLLRLYPSEEPMNSASGQRLPSLILT